MTIIFHIAERQAWEKAQNLNSYHIQTLETEGFIHCSQPQQVIKTANKFFYNHQNLVLLFIETEKVKAEIRYEFGEVDELFPHIYGDLNIDAVYQVIDFQPDQNGFFNVPQELNNLINS